MMLRCSFLLAALVSGCTCNKTITEKPPDELAARGIVIDQPAEGAKLTGAWVTVAGWVAPEGVESLAAIGAPVDGFYEVGGHVGVPSVPVVVRKDGRFFAPRVPLRDGEVTLKLIPFGKGGASYETVTRTVSASQTSVVPATLVIEPAQPKPGEKATLRATTGADLSTSFQWDFDGDGTFEAEGASATHAWEAGRYTVVARTKVNDVWVSAVSNVAVGNAPKVLAAATLTHAPSCIAVLSARPPLVIGVLPDAPRAPGTRVAVCDGDEVKVFDENLALLFTLPGLAQPSDVTWDDEKNIYVADTGHDRIVRFKPTGELDVTFQQGGEFRGSAGLPLTRPTATSPELDIVLADGRLIDCSGRQSDQPGCSVDTEYDAKLKELGVTLSGRFRDGYALTTDSRLLAWDNGLGVKLRKTRSKVVDVAAGPAAFNVDFATVNSEGAIELYRTARHDATWVLPYKATAIGSDITGRLYVGGPGVVELRDFEALR